MHNIGSTENISTCQEYIKRQFSPVNIYFMKLLEKRKKHLEVVTKDLTKI